MADSGPVVRYDAPRRSVRIRMVRRHRMGLNQQPHRSFGYEHQKYDAQERAKSEPREAEHVEHGYLGVKGGAAESPAASRGVRMRRSA
jgi:hypothetical protein